MLNTESKEEETLQIRYIPTFGLLNTLAKICKYHCNRFLLW